MSAILLEELAQPGKDIWCLFVPTVRKPMSDSVKFLFNILSHCDLPEKYKEKLVTVESKMSKEFQYPLRKQLIDWLLPTRDGDEEGSKSICKTDSVWTAQVLFMLILRNPSSLQNKSNKTSTDQSSDLERWYLKSVMEVPLDVEGVVHYQGDKSPMQETVHVPLLLKEIESVFDRDVQYYCRMTEHEVKLLRISSVWL